MLHYYDKNPIATLTMETLRENKSEFSYLTFIQTWNHGGVWKLIWNLGAIPVCYTANLLTCYITSCLVIGGSGFNPQPSSLWGVDQRIWIAAPALKSLGCWSEDLGSRPNTQVSGVLIGGSGFEHQHSSLRGVDCTSGSKPQHLSLLGVDRRIWVQARTLKSLGC